VDLSINYDALRVDLQNDVGLPFAPANYRVWRNYARVFKILGLASKISGKLQIIGLCNQLLAHGDYFLTYDDYILHLVKVFYYPSPIFQAYNVNTMQTFPFCAILRYMLANAFFGSDHITQFRVTVLFMVGTTSAPRTSSKTQRLC
jgi:hypothetical protein